MSNPKFMLGYDYQWLSVQGDKRPLYAPIGHTIVVGGSGSGKSTSVLYWLWKLVKNNDVELTIVDFKASHEFAGIVAEPERFAESNELACYSLIEDFYNRYTSIPEGGDSRIHVLLIDEAAGLLNHLSLTKEGSALANKIRLYLSSLLMGGRSRLCFTWLVMQRYSASIFPSSSGAADNFHVCVGLGRLTVDGRKGLFAGEHFEGEENLQFGQGRGIVLIDGQPLRALIIPKVSKAKLLKLLQGKG